MKKTLTVFVVLLLSLPLAAIVSACEVPSNPTITLSPPQGFAMTMISGTGFNTYRDITVTYDSAVQPTIPTIVKSDGSGSFNAIVAIPDELAVGVHTITVTDSSGCTASATFTVVDMKGAQGLQGVEGQDGISGINGQDFNSTGSIVVVNGTDGLNGQNFNATGNVIVANGTNGLNGLNGTNGINGANGINGKDGATGAQGPQVHRVHKALLKK